MIKYLLLLSLPLYGSAPKDKAITEFNKLLLRLQQLKKLPKLVVPPTPPNTPKAHILKHYPPIKIEKEKK